MQFLGISRGLTQSAENNPAVGKTFARVRGNDTRENANGCQHFRDFRVCASVFLRVMC